VERVRRPDLHVPGGFGFLVDFATYNQDQTSKQQISLSPDVGVRDFRLLFKGKFKTERPLSWGVGVMYDGNDKKWHFRKTGLLIAVPELSGHIFVGRDKEGYSLIKIMVGYDGWTIERSTSLDAFIPILADGVKYMGFSPRTNLLWNVGWFGDALSNRESFSSYHDLFVARLAWLPILSESGGKLLHVAVMAREGTPEDNLIKQRSRPEVYLASYFVDTGQFPADHAQTVGFEAYYRARNLLVGTEQNFQSVSSAQEGNPLFYGGEALVSWVVTGETRAYNTVGGYFRAVSPTRTVFEGGHGAVDVGMRFSYIDLDGGNLNGGKFWRLTPTVNWYLADFLRLEAAYGYGGLDRFGLSGKTQFFQARIQTCY
jgi:phosphate-selective porin OprO/OprP